MTLRLKGARGPVTAEPRESAARLALIMILAATGSLAEADRPDGPVLALCAAVISDESFELPGPGATMEGKEYQLTAWQHLSDAGPVALRLGLDYQYTRYEYEGIEGRNRDLHRLQIPLRSRYATGLWRVDSFLAPGISTSSNVMKDLLDDATSDDVLITARVEADYGENDRFRWLAGAAWDRTFGENRLYPIAGVLYAPRPALRARLAFPESELEFQFSGRQQALVRLSPAGHEWHVVSEELNDDFDYRVKAWRGELFWSYRLWRRLFLDVGGAWETGRHHEFVDDEGTAVDADLADALVFSVGLRLGETGIPRSHRITY